MHPLVFIALALACLGVTSYGITLLPLNEPPKQLCQFGVVVLFLALVTRYFNLL